MSRVLLVTTSTGAAGAERVVEALARGLAAPWQVEVAYLTGEPSPLDRRIAAAGVPVHYLGGVRHRPLRLLRELRARIAAVRPQLVHTHLHHANVLGAWALPRGAPTALLQTVHVIEGRRRPLRPVLDRIAARRAGAVVAVSQSVQQHLRELGIADARLRRIRNGIDLARCGPDADSATARAALGVEPRAPTLVAVGRLDRQKGFDLLLAALVPIAAQQPRVQLLVAGEGPERTRLQQRAAQLGVGGRVHWLGHRDDVGQVFAAADVVAFPSRWEGFGLVLAEAGAAARPVVAFDLPPCREILVEGETGYLVARGDVGALAHRLVELLAVPARAAAMGRAAREHAVAAFDRARMVSEYAVLYRDLLSGRRTPSR
ncbi:MAG: glycosyltransferase [Planctomycetes bacterium]|nr:glycosyltransferase [Planctomycetota bacterium]MCB9869404.1 glycosyltransferase [Planctomycetota bacterium]